MWVVIHVCWQLSWDLIAYADDLILLCPTLHAIRQRMLVAKSYSDEFNIRFNASKTQLVPFGNAVHGCVSTNFDGKAIDCTFSTTHLGHTFGPHATDNGIDMTLLK